MLINYVTLDRLPNLLVPPVSFSKMKKIMPSWLSFSWGYWQSKWVHVQCMRCSKERCWWNVKFALASLKNVITLLFCSSSWPVEGPLSFEQGRWQVSLSSLAPAGLLPVSAWWRILWCRVGHLGGGDPGTLTLLSGDGVLGVGRLWITGETVGPLAQGATLWAEAGGSGLYRKDQTRAGWAHKPSVMKGPETGSEILPLLGH